MVFSSPIFLFGFLPLALLLYYLSPRLLKNITLLIFSLIFYSWGEVFYSIVMIISITANYYVGGLIDKYHDIPQCRKLWLTVGVVVNLLLLISFKYVNFIADNLNTIFSIAGLSTIELSPIHLPLGISFFTFQAISYIVDVYRREVRYQRNILDLALYISLFPQLIAGPIVRYHDVSQQIENRTHSYSVFASGVQRFIYGLAKKMLIANPLGEVADSVFVLTGDDLTMPLAWLGILAYTLQIFFDFSGYSDMAIGLGRMFGFHFLENFNYPYISTSLREFWRRWHISLSTWFRDYVYIPLGGNKVSATRVYINLLLVFILTGFWHGASWNFLIWGLFHGIFLASEHAGFSNLLNRLWKPLQHAYLILVVIIGWVFFRADTLPLAISYLTSLFSIGKLQTTGLQFAQVLSYESMHAFVIGIVLSMPVSSYFQKNFERLSEKKGVIIAPLKVVIKVALLSTLLFLSMIKVASSTFNPFIYFRF